MQTGYTGPWVDGSTNGYVPYNLADYAEFDNLSGGSLQVSQFINDTSDDDSGIAAVQIVDNVPGFAPIALANAVNVTQDSTIDVTGASTATVGNLTIGGDALHVTGGGSGPNSPYTLTAGGVTLTGNATFDVADNGTAVGKRILGSIGEVGSGTAALPRPAPGTLVLSRYRTPTRAARSWTPARWP